MSVDVSTINMISEVIEEFTDLGKSFTALDVSRKVQASGVRARHSDMKGYVHAMFYRGDFPTDYSRTLTTIHGTNFQAQIYHPDTVDPDQYRSPHVDDSQDDDDIAATHGVMGQTQAQSSRVGIATNPTLNPTLDPVDDDDIDDDDDDDGELLVKSDARGRVCIPKALLVQLGLVHGDRCYCQSDEGNPIIQVFSLTKLKKHGVDSGVRVSHGVDKSGNIRISRRSLEISGIENCAEYAIWLEDDCIYIEEA